MSPVPPTEVQTEEPRSADAAAAGSPTPERLLAVAREAARAGGVVLERCFGDRSIEVHQKGEHDFVSAADHGSEEAVVGVIRSHFPDHAILAEERGAIDGSGAIEWVIDPLDGTTNFLQGLPVFCVSVACHRGGELLAGAIYEPPRGLLYGAGRGLGADLDGEPLRVSDRGGLTGAVLATGYPFRARGALDCYLDAFREVFGRARAIRRCGAAALDLAWTAAGIFDGFFEFRLSPWDIAAGVLLVREAGGVVTDLDGGERFLAAGNVVAGTPGVHPELLAAVARHADEAVLAERTPAPGSAVEVSGA